MPSPERVLHSMFDRNGRLVELVRAAKGRDNTANVVAMMKLVAPKLILDATAAPKKTKD
ncbi:hypothetical protein [Nonomuraea turcica]|uniref:hypothetical protein n=1 Tax=Nonomuraea sp. G32 TaxID=3067274 RepID=UPI00273B3F85|nr:hypothetical protein [Nonomuraea sp. G32]MDP4505856.1 hypothetical protein [Nonomuraea sp. G32]